jgi:hypothetical protein
MKIVIETIPHKDQRYRTCGDWYERDGVFHIRVSEEMGADSCFLVALHELVEWYLATVRGVKEKDVDAFDIQYEKERDEGKHSPTDEPGFDPKCPVYQEHVFADAIEKLMSQQIGIPWHEHEKNVNQLE